MGLYILLWSLSGIVLFIWAWTAHNDLTTEELPLLLVSGFMGPLIFIPLLALMDKSVIMKCRKDKE